METKVETVFVKSVMTKTDLPVGDFSVNPYIGCGHGCKYCYASFMKRFTGHAEPWGTFVDVKEWKKLADPSKYCGKEVFLGSVTDPYQPLEEKYGRTRALLEELKGSGAKVSIATKSDLVLRDLDLIKSFPSARVSWSVNTLDESFRSDMDAAPSIERRFAAMRAFHDAGVRTTCFISPIFPAITDAEAIIRKARDICNLVWLENLNLRGAYKSVVMGYIAEKYPELLPLYKDIYIGRDRSYWMMTDEKMREFCASEGLDYVRNDDSMQRPFDAPPVVVNYFFHETVKRSARKNGSLM